MLKYLEFIKEYNSRVKIGDNSSFEIIYNLIEEMDLEEIEVVNMVKNDKSLMQQLRSEAKSKHLIKNEFNIEFFDLEAMV